MTDTAVSEHVAARVRELAGGREPPGFDHVPTPDAALFLAAIDHRTGYRRGYLVGGRGPFEGSALLWELGCAAERRHPGTLTARALLQVSGGRVADLFRIGGETLTGPDERARLWRELAAGLMQDHGGEAGELVLAAQGRLRGSGGLLDLLGRYEAFADPGHEQALLFASIAEWRGWLTIADPKR